MMRFTHQSPPFGGWSRRRDPSTLLHGVVGRAVAAFRRMPHLRGVGAPGPAERAAAPHQASAGNTNTNTNTSHRQSRHRRSALSLLCSRRHGRDRMLNYVILPAIAILTVIGIFVLLRS